MTVEVQGLPQETQLVTMSGKPECSDCSNTSLHDIVYTIIQLLDEESILHIGSAV